MGVGALQRVEGHLQAKPKEPAGRAEEVVRGRRQQVDEGGVAADRRDDVALEGFGVAAVAVLEALEELASERDQLIDCRRADAGVHGGMSPRLKSGR